MIRQQGERRSAAGATQHTGQAANWPPPHQRPAVQAASPGSLVLPHSWQTALQPRWADELVQSVSSGQHGIQETWEKRLVWSTCSIQMPSSGGAVVESKRAGWRTQRGYENMQFRCGTTEW